MSLSSGHPEGNEHMDSTESSISNILKLILNLSPEKVKGSQALTGLRVIREAIDRLIADASRAEFVQPEEQSTPAAYLRNRSGFVVSQRT